MWAGSTHDGWDTGGVSPVSKSETVQAEREPASCVWCEGPVRLTGQFCSSDCYAFFYAYLLRQQIDRNVAIIDDTFPTPLPLEANDWYEKLL